MFSFIFGTFLSGSDVFACFCDYLFVFAFLYIQSSCLLLP